MVRAPQTSRFKFVQMDIDELQEQLPQSRECVKLRPLSKAGKVSMENLQFSVGSFDIWRTDCGIGVEASFDAPPDSCALYLPIAGAMEVRCRGLDLVSKSDSILVGKLQQTEFVRKHAGRSHIGVTFSQNALKRELSLLLDRPVTGDVDFAIEIEANTTLHGYLMSLGGLLWSTFANDKEEALPLRSTELLFRSMLVCMLEQLPHTYSSALKDPAAAAVPRHVKRAIDFMMAHLDTSLEMADLAIAAGVSIRALQSAFQQFKDTTPSDYWRQLRLEAVRRDFLVSGDLTVSAVARRYGFVHMGHFSALYKAAFGELPNETIRRGRESQAQRD